MFNVLPKLSLVGASVSGVLLLDVRSNNSTQKFLDKNKVVKEAPSKIEDIEDISLYEKIYGCSFVFVTNNESSKLLYNVTEFLEKDEDAVHYGKQPDDLRWHKNSIKFANQGLETCKSGGVFTVFKDGGDFLTTPTGGWTNFGS